MRIYILLLYISVHFFLVPQKQFQPIIGIGVGPMVIGRLPFYTTSVYAGIRMNEKWCFNTHVGYTIAYFKYKDPRVGILTNSFSASYRFFKKYKISPLIKTELGYQLWSNANGKYINANFYTTDEYGEYTIGTYKYFGPYLSEKLYLSAKGKHLEFIIGGGFRANLFVYDHNYSPRSYDPFLGIELEVGFTYTFSNKMEKNK